jgi:hypothetical protein
MGPHRCGHCGRVLLDRAQALCDSLCAAERRGRRLVLLIRLRRRGRPR